MNRPITSEKIESVVINPPTKKNPRPDDFTSNSIKHLRINIDPSQLLPKEEEKEFIHETSIILTQKPGKDIKITENYRPIYAINIDVKILNKTLANST